MSKYSLYNCCPWSLVKRDACGLYLGKCPGLLFDTRTLKFRRSDPKTLYYGGKFSPRGCVRWSLTTKSLAGRAQKPLPSAAIAPNVLGLFLHPDSDLDTLCLAEVNGHHFFRCAASKIPFSSLKALLTCNGYVALQLRVFCWRATWEWTISGLYSPTPTHIRLAVWCENSASNRYFQPEPRPINRGPFCCSDKNDKPTSAGEHQTMRSMSEQPSEAVENSKTRQPRAFLRRHLPRTDRGRPVPAMP